MKMMKEMLRAAMKQRGEKEKLLLILSDCFILLYSSLVKNTCRIELADIEEGMMYTKIM
jgi:hypothetical protein